MIKTIIFDFDGTLADCKKLHQDGFRDAVNQLCHNANFDDELVEGRPTREKIRILHTLGYQFNGDKLNEIKQAHTQTHIEKYISYNEDLAIQLERLSKKYKLCLATNATQAFINRSLDIMKIKHYFTKINPATDFPAKPDTITFLDCMKYTGSAPPTTLIVEDSPVGIQCARATGSKVLEVNNVEDTIRKIKQL